MNDELAEVTEASYQVVGSSALVAITKGEIDTQIATAKRYPRSLKRFKEDSETIACNDPVTAESCWYDVPRDGKTISGPSVRLAEICATAWGNLRFGSRLIDVNDKSVTAQGFAHDLQTNVAVSVEVDVPILKRDGKRYSESMILNAGRSAQSIALRNAIFRVIPKALVNQILMKARECAKGSIKSIEASRAAIADYFKKLGIDAKRVAGAVGKTAIDDLNVDDILTLRGIARAIKEEGLDLEAAFPRKEIEMPKAKPPEPEKPQDKPPADEPKKRKKKAEEPEHKPEIDPNYDPSTDEPPLADPRQWASDNNPAR